MSDEVGAYWLTDLCSLCSHMLAQHSRARDAR
jgi:hypothetical protein